MGIVLNSKKKLDSNDYNAIIIRKLQKGYVVNVQAKNNKFKTEQQYLKFSDSLKNLNEEEQVSETIEYFLRNNKINFVSDFKYMPYYEGTFSIVKSNKSLLALQIPAILEDYNVGKKILEKYRRDRIEFLYKNSDIKNYEILKASDSSYSYSDLKYKSGQSRRSIKFHINDSDMAFLKEFLKEKLIEEGKHAEIKKDFLCSRDIGYILLGVNLHCGDLKVKLDKKIIPIAKKIVDEHNLAINESKKKQLKLEGF